MIESSFRALAESSVSSPDTVRGTYRRRRAEGVVDAPSLIDEQSDQDSCRNRHEREGDT